MIPRRLNFVCRHFGTLCSIFVGLFLLKRLMKMEQTECSETSAHKIQTRENNPKKKDCNVQNTAKVWNQEKCTLILWYIFLYNILTNMFRPVIRPSSGWCYTNTLVANVSTSLDNINNMYKFDDTFYFWIIM